MANRYWVGGNAAWDVTAGTKWATTSGGAGGSAIPTAADDVFFDNGAGTGNITSVTAAAVARSINFTNYVGTFTHTAGITIAIGDATAGAGNIALKLVAGMTYTRGGASTSAFSFVSTSATQQTIAGGGQTFGNVTINGAGSSYLLNDAIVQNATATWSVLLGTLTFNSLNHTFGFFSSSVAGTRSVVFSGSENITCAGAGGSSWNMANTAALTFTKATGTITITGGGSTLGANSFIGGSLTYNNVVLAPTASAIYNIGGANTFANLTYTAPAAKFNELRLPNNQVVTGTLTLTGNSAINRCLIRSSTVATKRTLTVATLSANSYVDFMDITAAGASSPWSDSGWGILNVTSITGATAQPNYWVGGAGNWSDSANHWASTSGGTAGTGRVPLIQDSAYLDANSGSGTVTLDMNVYPDTIDFTNTALTSFVHNGGFLVTYICGSLILSSSCPGTFGGFANQVVFTGRGNYMLTTPSTTFTTHKYTINSSGTYDLGSDFDTAATVAFGHVLGTVNTNNYTLDIGTMAGSGGTLNLGSSTVNINSPANAQIWGHSGTLNSGTSSIYILGTIAGSNQSLSFAGKTIYNLFITWNSTAEVYFTGAGAVTVNSIQMTGTPITGKSFRFVSGSTYTFLSNNFPRGTSGNVLTVRGFTAGSAATITSTVTLTTDYVSMQDLTGAGTGNPFYAGSHSTNVSGNTNWLFTDPPANGNFFMFF